RATFTTSPRRPTLSMSWRRMTSISGAPLPIGHVGEQRHLARALDRDRHLALVAPAGSRNASRTDLPALGDVTAQLVHILVVDLLHLVLAEEAGLPTDRSAGGRTLAPAGLPVSISISSARGHQNGMSSSAEPPKSSLPAVAAAGTNWRSPSPPP